MGNLMNIPEIRFPEFKDDWEHKQLNKLLSVSKTTNKDLKYGKEEVLSVSGELGIVNQIEHLGRSYAGVSVHNYGVVELNQIVYTKSPLKANPYGIIKLNKHKAGIVSTLYAVYNVKENTDGQFIECYFSLDDNLNRYLRPLVRKGAKNTLQVTDEEAIKGKLLFPQPAEQKKIAHFFSILDQKLNQLQEKLNGLEQYKKGMMQQLFNGEWKMKNGKRKFVPPTVRFKPDDLMEDGELKMENEIINSQLSTINYPDWEVKKLGEVASFRRGSFPQPYGLPKWYDDENGYPFIQVFDVDDNMLLKSRTKNKISELGTKQSVFVKAGTLIITIQGSIGRIAKTQYDAYIDRTLLIFQSYKLPVDVDYFKFVVFLLFEIEKTKAPGGTIKTITKQVLTNFTVPIPILKEQTKIANFLSKIDDKINAVNAQIETNKIYKKGLLQSMFVN